jgi:hypothetical protein
MESDDRYERKKFQGKACERGEPCKKMQHGRYSNRKCQDSCLLLSVSSTGSSKV